MKKFRLFLAITSAFTVLTGCSNPYQKQFSTEKTGAEYASYNNIITISDVTDSMNAYVKSEEVRLAGEESDSKYTVDDLKNLSDFLLTKETSDLSSKDYDLNGDNVWDVFDLCMMRSDINDSRETIEEVKMNIEVNGHTLTATLENNESAQALAELIRNEPVELNLNEYGGFEKVGALPESLPKNDENITTEAGDIMLYQGNKVTIFYDTNSWSYTKLGMIDNVTKEELKKILGENDVTVKFSLTE